MRFRKTIRIGKGIKLNLSKSGISTTIGIPGLSVNIGKKGTYLNTSIPGTGLYDRHKISGPSKKSKETKNTEKAKQEKPNLPFNDYEYLLNEDGSVEFYKDGILVEDDNIIKELRNNPKFAEVISKGNKEHLEMYEEKINSMTCIAKLSHPVYLTEVYRNKLAELNDADNVKTRELKELLNNNPQLIENIIVNWAEKLELPFEFDFELDIKDNSLYVDLDLPEIEDMLSEDLVELSNGTLIEKNKTEKEINMDYVNCVFGLAIFLTSYIYNIAIGIQEIVVSGYTQRRNDIGDLVDDYIYSVKFNRNDFANIDFEKNPEEIIVEFTNRYNLTMVKKFKAIQPYE